MNDIPMTLIAWSLDMRGSLMLAIKVVAGLMAFVLGWYVSSPVWRILYRVAFRQAIPGFPHFILRLASAVALGLGAYAIVGFGGGSGFGFGSGGSGSGTGTGDGASVAAKDKTTDANAQKKPISKTREVIEIEVLGRGAPSYKGEEKYYLIKRKEPAQTLEQVEKFVLENKTNVEVTIIRSGSSNYLALNNLDAMLNNHGVLHKEAPEKRKMTDGKSQE